MKTIILIRHAESKNNVDKIQARQGCLNCCQCVKLINWQQVLSICSLFTIPMNTDLSLKGEKMVTIQAENIKNMKIIETLDIELVVYSHLIRAKRTCYSIFSSSNITIMEHNDLFEKNVLETCHCLDLKNRVNRFLLWLQSRPELVICLVGHSAFFRILTAQSQRMENCEVSKFTLHPDGLVTDFTTLLQGGDNCFEKEAIDRT